MTTAVDVHEPAMWAAPRLSAREQRDLPAILGSSPLTVTGPVSIGVRSLRILHGAAGTRLCPKLVYMFRTLGVGHSDRSVEISEVFRDTGAHGLHAAVSSQLRIPSLTPSHNICPVFSMI